MPGSVTPEVLESKIGEVEADNDIEEGAKTRLLELYQKALSNLKEARANADAADAFQQAAQTAAAQILSHRRETEAVDNAPPQDSLEVDQTTTLAEIEQLLQKEKADLAAADAKRAGLEKRMEDEANRPVLIRQQLTEAKQRQREAVAQLELPSPEDEGPATVQARRWELETRYQALSTESDMLDAELVSQPIRVDLLQAQRDEAVAQMARPGVRVKIMEDLVNRKRQAEAETARDRAEATRREAEGKHPMVVRLAERNAELSAEIAALASVLDERSAQAERGDKLARQIEEGFQSARETIEIGGLSQELGHMLQQQRQSLPDLRTFRQRAKAREERAADVGVSRLRHGREAKQLRNLDLYVDEVLAEATPDENSPILREQIRSLAAERKALLEKALETDHVFLQKLGELESIQHRLLKAIAAYDAFLDEHLLWVRSTSRTQLQELGALPNQVWRIISPGGWLEVVRVLIYQATHSPAFGMLALALGALLWGRRHLIRIVRAMSDKLGKPTTDRFLDSVQALLFTLIAAAAWPLVFSVTGWQLKVSLEATDFSNAVGGALIAIAAQFFALRALRMICMPDGLASAHFRWRETGLRLLRKELDRLTWIYLPAFLVSVIAFSLDPLNFGWAIGRAAFVIMVGALGFSFYRLLHPKSGVLSGYMGQPDRALFRRLHRLWYPLLVAVPVALGVLSLLGYVYTAGVLTGLLIRSVWLIVGLVIIDALARRWLLVTRRQLAYEAALDRQQATMEAGQEQEGLGNEGFLAVGEEDEVDLAALSDTSRKLLHRIVVLSGLIGLWLIWSEVFPALRIFDDITLWHHTVRIDGEEQVVPVTLADIGLALIYLAITVVLAKQLPAVLEMILLDHSEMSTGNRYTVTTLTTYTVITVGIVLVFGTIGVDWSKLQWLIAALGVGIGFGLQEIVANFISGIILLFERPIRVGDFVSVGTTDGVVTRIRIRATTIRNQDGKELLVPNKAFITGNLLNWSLSDQTTRILISVGIAYGSNVREAMRLLEEAATENEVVMDDPAPSVIFHAFADSSLTMLLRCFVDSVDVRFSTISALNQSINEKFNAAGIVIAFPQRDLHLQASQPLRVSIESP